MASRGQASPDLVGPWFCPRCGGQVDRVQPSIDPRFPLGVCATNGKLPVTRDAATAQRLAAEYQAAAQAARKGAHL